jgi:GntR family histidine utilization transcriptional repressor
MKKPSNIQPLYERVKDSISRRIMAEEWPAQFRIPREDELAQEFDVSRLTVQRALRELQTEGLLVRMQGRGTFVVGPKMQCAVFELKDLAEEIMENGGVHTSEVVTLDMLSSDDPRARLLPVRPGTRVFHSRVVHKEDGTPIQLEDRFVNADEAPDYLQQDFTRITTYAYLRQATQVTSVDNTIRAIRIDEASKSLLQIDENQPCLLIDRRTWRGSVPVTRSRYVYPGDRYRLHSAHQDTIIGGRVDVRSNRNLGPLEPTAIVDHSGRK